MSQRARASTLVDGAGWPQARAAGKGRLSPRRPARRPCAHTAAHVHPSRWPRHRPLSAAAELFHRDFRFRPRQGHFRFPVAIGTAPASERVRIAWDPQEFYRRIHE